MFLDATEAHPATVAASATRNREVRRQTARTIRYLRAIKPDTAYVEVSKEGHHKIKSYQVLLDRRSKRTRYGRTFRACAVM